MSGYGREQGWFRYLVVDADDVFSRGAEHVRCPLFHC